MYKIFTMILVSLVVSPCMVEAKQKRKTFQGTPEQVFRAGLKAAQKHWRVTFSDKETLMFSFSTGTSLTTWGMDVGVTLKNLGSDRVEVIVGTQKKLQLFAWGAGGRIADKFFKELERQLVEDRWKLPGIQD